VSSFDFFGCMFRNKRKKEKNGKEGRQEGRKEGENACKSEPKD